MESKGPIGLVVEADEPALFFSSPKAAESYMELIDVQDGVYKAAYDSRGNPYTISVVGDQVLVCPSIDKQNDTYRLKSVLLNFLSRINIPASRDETLSALIAKCQPYVID